MSAKKYNLLSPQFRMNFPAFDVPKQPKMKDGTSVQW
jgi:hypothetical protein